ncbi:DoxX family protein [Pseudonocardia spinosispora]|uniref:DoxX family protein n=1 Tax=Pseudonocardia spinosispora TaxID=103441 RepID=UPI00048CF2B6|nr:membrane protein [Pseudonocardia spinosispora]
MASRPSPAAAMSGFLTVMGILHFVAPKQFDAIVPESLPGGHRTWTYLSGVAELGVAAAVASPRTRRTGGLLAAGLFIGVFPANVKMAIDWSDRPLWQRALVYGRLPLQIPMIRWALKVRREA